ncbi:MAG: S9 family peptidase, partial [Alphaproteobacteria bacterium]|nr:S9 family peptidase [Alphaproteobacteria bacterium]
MMLLTAALLSCVTSHEPEVVAVPEPAPLVYPETRRGDVVDDFHGTAVADPYRWLEDSDAPETRAWIEAQNALTEGILSGVPEREAIRARLEESWSFERLSVPGERGGRYFWQRQDGLQNQPVLFTGSTPFGEDARVLIDPNTLSEDGTVALAGYWVSRDGARMVYGVSEAGTDWRVFYVRDVASGEDLPDRIEHVKFSGASWDEAGEGFYYSAYDAPEDPEELEAANFYQKLWYHRLGTAQSEDVLVYERPDEKEWGFGGSVSDSGDWLLISNWVGTENKNRLLALDLRDDKAEVVELIMEFDAEYSYIGEVESRLLLLTDLDAPNRRILSVDPRNPDRADWVELVPERREAVRGARRVGDQLLVQHLKDAHSQVQRYSLSGAPLGEIALPGIGSAGGFGGRAESSETFYHYASYLDPGGVYRYDLATGESTLLAAPEVDFDAEAYTTRQVFYESKDGTRVPMILVHRRDLVADGQNATYLYGYGGFGIPVTPRFSPVYQVWL